MFDELYDAGLLAVGALEKGLGLSSEDIKRATSSRSTSTSGAGASGSSSSNQQQSYQSSRYITHTVYNVTTVVCTDCISEVQSVKRAGGEMTNYYLQEWGEAAQGGG